MNKYKIVVNGMLMIGWAVSKVILFCLFVVPIYRGYTGTLHAEDLAVYMLGLYALNLMTDKFLLSQAVVVDPGLEDLYVIVHDDDEDGGRT